MAGKAIAKAKGLLASGKTEEARGLLLDSGFIQREDEEIQREFERLIPPSPALAEHLDVLARVSAPDATARYKALNAISREVFQDTSIYLKSWLADPRTTDVLIAAAGDTDPKVAQEAAAVLSVVLERYFADLRAFRHLVSLLGSKRKQTRLYAVFGISQLAHPDRWTVLLPMFRDQAKEIRRELCRAIAFNFAPDQASKETRATLKRSANELLSDEEASVRNMAEKALQQLGG